MATKSKIAAETIFKQAHELGHAAAIAATPTPMVVQQHAQVMNDNSPVVKRYVVEGGVCGFAWINIKPANCAFAKWMLAQGYARKSDYEGGVIYSIMDYGQSMARKEAYAYAFANHLRTCGINAYAYSRID